MPARMHQPVGGKATGSASLAVWILIALTLAVRGGALFVFAERLEADPDGYRALAENVLEYGVLGHGNAPSAYRPPLYPLLLVPCAAVGQGFAVATGLVHLALGVATVLTVLELGRRWNLGRFAFLAAGLVACDPILLNQSTLIMTETLATLLAALALAALSWAGNRPAVRSAALGGAALVLAALCRPTFLAWLALASLGLLVHVQGWAMRAKTAAALLTASLLVLLPWALRNQGQFGRPIVSTTHGGYTLLLGNNPSFYEYLRKAPWGAVWHASELDRLLAEDQGDEPPRVGEVEADRRNYELARQYIQNDPFGFLYSCLVRVGRLWSVLPHDVERGALGEGRDRNGQGRWQNSQARQHPPRRTRPALLGVALWYLAEFALAMIGMGALRGRLAKPPWIWGLLLAASLTAVHAFYWTDMRMRAPLMPVVALLAAAGAGGICARFRGRKP